MQISYWKLWDTKTDAYLENAKHNLNIICLILSCFRLIAQQSPNYF